MQYAHAEVAPTAPEINNALIIRAKTRLDCFFMVQTFCCGTELHLVKTIYSGCQLQSSVLYKFAR